MFLILTLLSLTVYLFHELYWKRRNLPPGPTPFPFIGNLSEVYSSKAPGIEAFQKWSKQYGDVYTIWMGTTATIVVTGYQKLKDTFVNDAESYTDKKIFNGFNKTMRGGDYGVIDTNNDTWRIHRRFIVRKMKDFGLKKSYMQKAILIEVNEMIENLQNDKYDRDIQSLFDISIGNIINQFLFGKRLSDETSFHEIKNLIDNFFTVQGNSSTFLVYTVPWLLRSFIELINPSSINKCSSAFGIFENQIDEISRKLDVENEESQSYVEEYLIEQKQCEELGYFSRNQLKNICFDIWLAGLHTTSNTLGFMIAYSIRFRDCQRIMQKELTNVIGNRTITMKDKLSLPYTNAFIQETQRLCNLVPINLTHSTTRRVNINGYQIPHGTAVVAQISSVLWDPKVFSKPHNFVPERFLGPDGRLKKCDEFLPFSVGRRNCLGEVLAKMQLFLFAANLFNRFDFHPASQGLPSMERDFSFISKNFPYTCNIKQRYL